jgi:uncharacterized protein (TIGR03067 family)
MKPTMTILGMSVALGLASAVEPPARGDDSGDGVKAELARLKGTWVSVLDGKTYVMNFDGDRFAEIFEFAEGTSTTGGTVAIDPAKSPRQMDWTFTAAGSGRGEKLKGRTARTIYELDGDTFRFAGKPSGRLEKFPDREGVFPGDKEGAEGYIYLVFKRLK